MKNKDAISNDFIIQVAERFRPRTKPEKVLAGFDGFVDEILHVIKQRVSPEEYIRMDFMNEFANNIAAAAGFSANMEYASQQTKLGGNGPILANALLAAGHEIDYIGTLGEDEIHPVYRIFCEKCMRVTSFLEPGKTDAIEFLDGKIMMGRMTDLEKMNFTNLLKHYPENELLDTLRNSELLVMTDWNALAGMNSIYDGFAELLSRDERRIKVFIDLADPAKHSFEEIKEAMLKLGKLNKQADVMLGLNENESKLIAKALGLKSDEIVDRAELIRKELNLYGVVIHPIAGAAVAVEGDSMWLDGPVTNCPKLTTGAGDNFNAGFCNGWLAGLAARECLVTGVSTSGFYVRNCYSPNCAELLDFMHVWAEGNLAD